MQRAGFPEDYLIVALLHDTIEDGFEFADAAVVELMPPHIADAVRIINKPKTMDRATYLKIVSSNKYAKAVKLFDATFNLSQCILNKSTSRAEYYFDTIDALR